MQIGEAERVTVVGHIPSFLQAGRPVVVKQQDATAVLAAAVADHASVQGGLGLSKRVVIRNLSARLDVNFCHNFVVPLVPGVGCGGTYGQLSVTHAQKAKTRHLRVCGVDPAFPPSQLWLNNQLGSSSIFAVQP